MRERLQDEHALRYDHAPQDRRDVLRSLAAGESTAEIARELWVAPATLSKHLEHVYRKLGVSSRTAALAALRSRADPLR